MNIHKNAPLTPKGREAMVRSVIEGGLTKAAAALQFNVTAKTVAKWVKRFRASAPTGCTASAAPAVKAAIAIAARYSILMAMVPPIGPTN
ncbi:MULTISPECIES: leucine zipper domain-containing protein [unclassified Bradyrhizobium]|uniref:helix-turn-helix domain-containing protein n=1 Tax=unclassified Bradyrhizobium TaxID=2631580 RepID=UPI002479976C|nr:MULTISPECIES: leucine zipper domain-containing protein [unclassified Bradyrhizobium]